MNTLIPIHTRDLAGATQQTVNARELHLFLEVQTAFKDWMARRIADYGFEDGKDFCSFLSESAGGRPAKEYALTLDMAKELSMVERNEKGKEARLYFLECERKAKAATAVDPMRVLNDPAAMRGLLLTYSEKVIALEGKVAEQAPKVEALALLTESDGALALTDAGKVLEMTRDRFIRWLQALGWIYRRQGRGEWTAHVAAEKAGRVVVKITPFINSKTGETEVSHQVRITPKGMAKLAELRLIRNIGDHAA